MATLTYEQIKQVARAGGLPGDADMWAAVAMAESSGSTTVVNSIGCVGLWQINQPVHIRSHPTWTVAWLQNPVNNAKAAAVIYRGQGMAAWEAYTGPDGRGSDGPWRQYYKKGSGGGGGSTNATQAMDFWWLDPFGIVPGNPHDDYSPTDPYGGNPPYSGTVDGVDDVATGVGAIAEAVQKASQWLGQAKNWVRVGYVTGGAVLVLLGLNIVARPLLEAVPTAKVAKVAKSAAGSMKKGTKA